MSKLRRNKIFVKKSSLRGVFDFLLKFPMRDINDFVIVSKSFVNGFNFSFFITGEKFVVIGIFCFHDVIKKFETIGLLFILRGFVNILIFSLSF